MFYSNYLLINSAISDKKELEITTTNETKITMHPYKILVDDNESFNYLVGFIKNKKVPISIKLSKITKITKKKTFFSLTKEEINFLDKQLKNGPRLVGSSLISAYVQFDKRGLRDFARIHEGRPLPIGFDAENSTYEFNCDESRLYDYLKQFGNHANVLFPDKLRYKLKHFYENALNLYSKNV